MRTGKGTKAKSLIDGVNAKRAFCGGFGAIRGKVCTFTGLNPQAVGQNDRHVRCSEDVDKETMRCRDTQRMRYENTATRECSHPARFQCRRLATSPHLSSSKVHETQASYYVINKQDSRGHRVDRTARHRVGSDWNRFGIVIDENLGQWTRHSG